MRNWWKKLATHAVKVKGGGHLVLLKEKCKAEPAIVYHETAWRLFKENLGDAYATYLFLLSDLLWKSITEIGSTLCIVCIGDHRNYRENNN